MLVMSRRLNESVVIGEDIVLTVVEIRGDKVRLGLVAPRDKSVHRKEIWDLVQIAQSWAMIEPAWLTWNDGTVLRLAQAIAEEGNYAALPILADALEEAGCTNTALLGHCRSGGPPLRNSWVVDLILSSS